MIDPRLLRVFLAVCRARTISGAARALNLSQPSVSVSVATLERELGTSLFERSRRGIALTAAGDALMRRSELMESLLRDTREEIALIGQGVRGPLRIGGTPGALVSLAPGAVARLEQGGRFALHIAERPDAELVAMLRRGEIEVALVTTGIDTPPADIEERKVARDPFTLLVGRANDHLPASVSLRDTAELAWVMPAAEGGFSRQIRSLFIAAEVPMPRDVIRCDSLLTSKAIVRRTAHVTVLPRGVAAAELATGVLRAITISDVAFDRSIGVRTLAGTPLSELARAFLAMLASPAP